MKATDIISLISELPLNIHLKVKRKINDLYLASSDSFSDKLNSENILRNVEGYFMHTVFLTSSTCLNSSDLEEQSDGYYKVSLLKFIIKNYFFLIYFMFKKIKRTRNDKKENEDYLEKDDILYKFNHESLVNKNKREIISALKSINQVCELKVIRKAVSFQTKLDDCNHDDTKIPYHNEIFAKNSIKLPVRSSHYKTSASKYKNKKINRLDYFTDENGMYLLNF